MSVAVYSRAILDYETCIRRAEHAVLQADKSGSSHWRTLTSGLLATLLVEAGNLDRAKGVLSNFPEDMPTSVMGQRMIAIGRIDYYLGTGQHHEALELTDRMIKTARSLTSIKDAPDLIRRRGLALIGMGYPDQGLEALELALDSAMERRLTNRIWRYRHDLAGALTANAKLLDAEQQLNAAWHDVRRLARSLDRERQEHPPRLDELPGPRRREREVVVGMVLVDRQHLAVGELAGQDGGTHAPKLKERGRF
jgi:tetratricopeptide (TPR) repeat protein